MSGARTCILLAVGLAHGVALYALIHAHTRIGMDGPPMIRPAIAKNRVPEPIRAIESRPWQPSVAEVLPYPDRVWHFPRVDIWPMTGEPCPTPSEFGPIMDTQPVAEDVKAPTGTPRMVLWLRPAYPMQWARTEMEGTTRLAFKIRATGNTDEIQVERSSGSQKLDVAAAQAAKAWRFAPGRWQGRPTESKATIELTFNFFEYRVSAIDETTSHASRRDVAKIGHLDRSARIRTLVEALRSGTIDELDVPAYANARPSWPATMRDWGPISGIQYLGPIGAPEWRRYSVKLKHPAAKHAKTVVMRWELYRVLHNDNAALWEVAIDRAGGVWAVEAEPLENKERANNSQTVCPPDAPIF